jgi:hypothetical protein
MLKQQLGLPRYHSPSVGARAAECAAAAHAKRRLALYVD